MLQRRQLELVATRFPREIETLHEFFQATGPLPHGPDSLAAVTARLHEAGSFRRDFSSHLMIFAHGGIAPADLLGIVALAAADAAGAAASSEKDAHELLRFILATTAQHGPTAAPRTPTAARASTRWTWPVAAVCLLSAIVLGTVYVRHRIDAPTPQVLTAAEQPSVVPQPGYPAEVQPDTAVTAAPTAAPVTPAPVHTAVPHGTSSARPPLPRTATHPTKAPENTSAQPVKPVQEARAYPADRNAAAARVQPTTPSPAVEPHSTAANTAHPAFPTATPAAVLSRRLDARTMPTSDPAIDQASGRAYPRLWRRHPAGAPTPDAQENTLLAANLPPSKPGSYNAPAASAGTVRPVSLGTMAANIVYSPAPAYPQAAAAARVQGQVTIQAEVDRDGSVASARVVSGPPLLRDAALDAVLRWRYQPRTIGGKPVTAAATAMLEFEMP